jgi:hypothetical protein
MWIHGNRSAIHSIAGHGSESARRSLHLIAFRKISPGLYRPGQDWIGTVEMAFCGDPSITRSL